MACISMDSLPQHRYIYIWLQYRTLIKKFVTHTFGQIYGVQVVLKGFYFQAYTSDSGQTCEDSTAKRSFASDHLFRPFLH